MDGMTVHELPEYLKQHWPAIREQLLSGTYKPQPVKRVEIPKPDGGVRKLGIPTVLDRFIQQAVMQVLQRKWDRTFSDHSYGFRPGRSAHQAVAAGAAVHRRRLSLGGGSGSGEVLRPGQSRQTDGEDRGAGERQANVEADPGVSAAGVMENGLVSPVDEGTPQGGPLSPLLSNIVLDEFDRELERRGLRFARYADDSNIYVRSRRAGERVMESVTRFITRKLKLKVNQQKSAVARPWERKFLGFSFTSAGIPKRRIAPKAVDRFKERVRELTSRTRGVSIEQMAEELTRISAGMDRLFRQMPNAFGAGRS